MPANLEFWFALLATISVTVSDTFLQSWFWNDTFTPFPLVIDMRYLGTLRLLCYLSPQDTREATKNGSDGSDGADHSEHLTATWFWPSRSWFRFDDYFIEETRDCRFLERSLIRGNMRIGTSLRLGLIWPPQYNLGELWDEQFVIFLLHRGH